MIIGFVVKSYAVGHYSDAECLRIAFVPKDIYDANKLHFDSINIEEYELDGKHSCVRATVSSQLIDDSKSLKLAIEEIYEADDNDVLFEQFKEFLSNDDYNSCLDFDQNVQNRSYIKSIKTVFFDDIALPN